MKAYLLPFWRQYKIHLICWALFICYEVLLVGMLKGVFGSFWDYVVHYAINAALFYLHATVVLPFMLQKHRPYRWMLPFVVGGVVAAYIALVYTVEWMATQYLGMQLTRPLVFDYFYCLRSTWRAIYFIGLATGYYFLNSFIREKLRADQAERLRLLNIIENQHLQTELIRSQNAFLKAQINPHFLFNTLSFVYNKVRKTSTQAAEAVLSLSDMMRYALQSEDEFEESDLLEEIEHTANLVRIHQLRHGEGLQISLDYGPNLSGIKIIPLVLITLVENVFKHGDLSQPVHPARIRVTFENSILHITTVNLKKAEQPAGHRIGLQNIRHRLELAYQDRVLFQAQPDEKGYFRVSLELAVTSTAGQLQHQAAHGLL